MTGHGRGDVHQPPLQRQRLVPFGEMLGEIAQCPDCGVELEVLSAEPLALGLAPQVEEDWGE